MGSERPMMTDARPVHRVKVDSFYIDETEVTNRDFKKFVDATGYITLAEQTPQTEAGAENTSTLLSPGSLVFSPPTHAVKLNNPLQWWRYVPGASWRQPEGPGSDIQNRLDHPVVHVTWEDAMAYAKWAKKRLPTEAEWEYAARGKLSAKKFPWGDEFKPEGKFMANTFQGRFPDINSGEDGFIATAPVKSFPPNGFGLYDTAGNVWEWVSDWYRADYFSQLASAGDISENPKGPELSYDAHEPAVPKRVQKGGSFLCTDQYCSRYLPGSRGKGDPSTGNNHVGFRLAVSARP